MLYYQVPSMGHCFWSDSYPVALSVSGTPPLLQQYRAPWFLSGVTQGSAAFAGNPAFGLGWVNNASSDMFAALIRWVETPDQKPRDIIATTFNASNGYASPFAQRPICPFPETARYKLRSTNPNFTTSWECQ